MDLKKALRNEGIRYVLVSVLIITILLISIYVNQTISNKGIFCNVNATQFLELTPGSEVQQKLCPAYPYVHTSKEWWNLKNSFYSTFIHRNETHLKHNIIGSWYLIVFLIVTLILSYFTDIKGYSSNLLWAFISSYLMAPLVISPFSMVLYSAFNHVHPFSQGFSGVIMSLFGFVFILSLVSLGSWIKKILKKRILSNVEAILFFITLPTIMLILYFAYKIAISTTGNGDYLVHGLSLIFGLVISLLFLLPIVVKDSISSP